MLFIFYDCVFFTCHKLKRDPKKTVSVFLAWENTWFDLLVKTGPPTSFGSRKPSESEQTEPPHRRFTSFWDPLGSDF